MTETSETRWSIAIHGGAGSMTRETMDAAAVALHEAALEAALRAGETVAIAKVKDHGTVMSITEASPERRTPACRHFGPEGKNGTCGGCSLQHLADEPYHAYKRELVVSALKSKGLTPDVDNLVICRPGERRRAVFAARKTEKGLLLGFSALVTLLILLVVPRIGTEGGRALLNLGHTFGHALEAETGFSDRLLHGEGVALGMVLAARFSVRQGLMAGQDAERVVRHIGAVGLPASLKALELQCDGCRLVDHMLHDKKMDAGRLPFLLMRGIGQTFLARDVDLTEVAAFLDGELAA